MNDQTGCFRVLLRMRIRPGAEAEFERTWLSIGDMITRHRGNLGQWLMASTEEPGIYHIISDWVDEAVFREFEHSAEHLEHRKRLHPYRIDGSMTTARIVFHLPAADRAVGPAHRGE